MQRHVLKFRLGNYGMTWTQHKHRRRPNTGTMASKHSPKPRTTKTWEKEVMWYMSDIMYIAKLLCSWVAFIKATAFLSSDQTRPDSKEKLQYCNTKADAVNSSETSKYVSRTVGWDSLYSLIPQESV